MTGMKKKTVGITLALAALIAAAGTAFAQSGQNGETITRRYEAAARSFDSLAQKSAEPSNFGKSSFEREARALDAEVTSLGNEHIYFVSHGGTLTPQQESRIEAARTKIMGASYIINNNVARMTRDF